MAEPAWHLPPVRLGLRVATTPAQLAVAGERLCMAPAALAAAMVEPGGRLLVDEENSAVLLRREWAEDGAAEAVILSRAGVPQDHPAILATAVGWGCDRVRHQLTGRTVGVPVPSAGAPLVDRFRHLAAVAATRVETAVALAPGSPSWAADEAAHEAAVAVLRGLGVAVLSEQRRDAAVPADGPWIVLDPLDGTGNRAAGLPPWAFSAALVSDGRPVAGLVADLSSGRRWSGAAGAGAHRDGVPVAPRPGGTVVVPSAPTSDSVVVPSTARRVRISGCTAIDLCLVADGSAAGWHDVDRSGSHVHDVAGGLAVLLAAGGVALTPDGDPLVLRPDAHELVRFVAAPDVVAARELLRAVG
ncbi:MAG: suhB [Blastococcus sp.]|nr:suhB [Blastococcus sp.]